MLRAESAGGATLTIQPDGSVLASGKNPAVDDHYYTMRTERTGLRLLCVDAIADASLQDGRVGRAPNGNAVLSQIEVEAASLRDPAVKKNVTFRWAWADHEQLNGDYRAVNAIEPDIKNRNRAIGWAVQGHERGGGRALLLLSEEPFGFEGGTELRVALRYQSVYSQHTLGRVRFALSNANDAMAERLPAAASDWYLVGPFPQSDGPAGYGVEIGPELDANIDLTKNFGAGNQYWKHQINLADGVTHDLPDGVNITYVGRRLYAPAKRFLEVSIGSDDGIMIFVNGKKAFEKRVDRGVAPDQDKASIELREGLNAVVFKIINIGGQAGFYYKPLPASGELSGDLAGALVPEFVALPDLGARVARAWRLRYSPGYKQRTDEIGALKSKISKLDGEIPLTMIMKELPEPRETFVLTRGVYSKPDKNRKVSRGVPEALGAIPAGAGAGRLGLAAWLVAPENPLVARVAANRLFEWVFGAGIVRTSEDFGHQGEWPSHPELLDWLAVEFRECGWNIQHILKRLVTSAAYRQQSRRREDAAAADPENRLLAYFPRRRLTAEQVRDGALYISGLLVEKLGGPSAKPYQPPGLWEEVAMPASNTRSYKADTGPGLYRRSIYTYWKRASPPPSLMTLDAPTREFCTIRRSTTNTPLQALVLWNDEQFVESSRAFAQRALLESLEGGERARIIRMLRRCASRAPDAEEIEALEATLSAFRERYKNATLDAKQLIAVGASRADAALDPTELAAWTMLANAMLNLDATICKN